MPTVRAIRSVTAASTIPTIAKALPFSWYFLASRRPALPKSRAQTHKIQAMGAKKENEKNTAILAMISDANPLPQKPPLSESAGGVNELFW